MKKALCILILSFLLPAATISGSDLVKLKSEVQPKEVTRGVSGFLIIECIIRPGFHLSTPASGFFTVGVKAPEGYKFGTPDYPKGEPDSDAGPVYRGTVRVRVPFRIEKAESGDHIIPVEVTVQPCDEAAGICYPPETLKTSATITVLNSGNSESAAVTEDKIRGIAGRLSDALSRGSWAAFLIVFLGGLLTSLTPCVYPMIPITMAVIGAQADGGKLKGFVLSLFYVLGISVTFSTLGIIAAKTGALFGALAGHPAAVALVASIFFLMGLSLLGVFTLQMPAGLAANLRGGRRKKGFIGAFLTGLLAGIVVSPCISPLLVVILTWVAQSGSVLMGIGLLVSFSLGLGVLFILIGTFSGIIKNLPKSGGWMVLVERSFGILLLVLALVFLRPLLSVFAYRLAWSAYLVVFSVFTGAFMSLGPEDGSQKRLFKSAGIMSLLVAGSLVFFAFAQELGSFSMTGGPPPVSSLKTGRIWLDSDTEAFQQASVSQKPVLIDFYADWCAACKELEEKTWPDPRVEEAMNEWITVKLDLTRYDDKARSLQKKYGIVGMPTVILFDAAERELGRFEGFQPAEEVVRFLETHIR